MTEPKRLLVVDDEIRNCRLMQGILKSLGHRSEIAMDGFEALAMLKPDIDLVLLDVMMPGMDGFEVARRIREDPVCGDIPIVMVTILTSKEDRLRAVKAGANDFVTKPVDKVELQVRLASLLKMKEAQDAVKRHRAELEETVETRTADLRKSEKKYRTLFEDSADAIVVMTPDGNMVDVNRAFLELFGYSQEQIITMNMRKLCGHPEDQDGFLQEIDQQGFVRDREWKARRSDGAERDCLFTGSVQRDEHGNIIGLQCVIRDVTEMKLAEKEHLRLVTAVEQAAETILITDTDGTILYANPAFEKVTGYSSKEAVGRNPRILKSGKHDMAFYKNMWETLTSGEVWRGHFINKKRDGELFEEDVAISPVKDEAGKIVNYVAVKHDVTTEVMLERRLRQAQKLEAIGTLAGGIAHDFNNILYAITGYSELTLDAAPEGSRLKSNVERILEAADRAADLVKQILTFSRQAEQEKQPIKVAPIVKEAFRFLRASIPTTIEMKQSIQPDLGVVMADATQIHQVLMNLCTNAAYAMAETGGELMVSLDSFEVDTDFAAMHEGIVPGPFLRVVVTDTGHGMNPEILERIFYPYFTTKAHGEGTGLGLAQVHGIVKSHGGTITVESELGKGAAFQVYLPVFHGEDKPQEDAAGPLATGHERILLVDDEQTLALMGEQILTSLGYQVATETTSKAALEVFSAEPDRFDLVITDLTMPGLTGLELGTQIMSIRPNVPVILCTGFSREITDNEAKSLGIYAIVRKPINRNKMATTIRNALDGTATKEK